MELWDFPTFNGLVKNVNCISTFSMNALINWGYFFQDQMDNEEFLTVRILVLIREEDLDDHS